MNAEKEIATKALYVLLLGGQKLKPEEVCWYVAFPNDMSSSSRDYGTLQRVWFSWNGVGYFNARYDTVSSADVPIDLSDIIEGSA
jgi:hypothetical protein